MTLAVVLAYAAALFLAVATPGPAMIAVLSTGTARGFRPAASMALGIALGDLALVGLALLGLVALVAAFGWLFVLVKYAGAAYLIWLGVKLWRAGAMAGREAGAGEGSALRAATLGAAIALSNPKAILFHASLMPLIIDLQAITPAQAMIVLAVAFTVDLATLGGYAALSGSAGRWLRTPRRLRWMNRIAGGSMVGAGLAIASR